ncbi:MAG: ABC transporter permease [Chloroflexi bacterium]|nr:ABC transporter permease [Chloroflexota bacterium]
MTTDTLAEGESGLEAAAAPKPRSEWTMAWRRLRRNKAALAGLGILIVISLAAIFADLIATEPENHFDILAANLPPGSEGHPLGTDDIGRDVFSRIVRGSRISLRVGFSAVTISAIVGTLIGLSAGYFGRWVDMVISRIIDVMLAFPGLLLAMTVVAALGSGLNNAMIALGVAGIPFYARVVRSTTLAARELVYVRAARAVGMSDTRIMLRHILPNIVSPILIMATLGLGGAILAAAGLSFLGLGAERPSPEWGLELSSSRHLLRSSWWISTFNGLAIAITVLSINLLGDGLREALDPQAGAWSH